MSFSSLFAKLPGVTEDQSCPNVRNDMASGQSVSRKRKAQKQPGSHFKRQCVRSNAINSNEETPEEKSDARRHLRPRDHRVEKQEGNTASPHTKKQENVQRYKDFNKGRRGRGARFTHRECGRSNATAEEETSPPDARRHLRPRVSCAPAHKGNTNGHPHKKNQEYAQRYKDFNKGRRGKNAPSAQPQKRFMTQEFKDQHALEADGRLLCKFFILGRCTKGEDCQLEHAEGHNDLIKEACKFYIQACCLKGATCPYMHKSIPCKFFHVKGKCHSPENCRFSHEPLTDVTQKILEAQIQRDKELSELGRKAEEPPSQTANEEQHTNENIVIPAVRPSFYQSSESAVEVEPSQPHNELQSDPTEKDVAPETENITTCEDSLALDQPGPVCYSVEALLGPQLFKPVLHTATNTPPRTTTTKTESPGGSADAPYSVANVLRSQSMFNSYLQAPQNVQPGAASIQLKERPTADDKYKVSHLKIQNVQEMFFKQTPSPHVMARSRSHKKVPDVNKETLKDEITAAKLKPAAEQSTADCERRRPAIGSSVSQQCQTSKELRTDKLDDSGPGSEHYEDVTVFSLDRKESGSGSLQRKRHEIIQENQETTREMNVHQSVLEKRPKFDAALPPAHVNTTSKFTHVFAKLNSNSDQTSSDNHCSTDKTILQKSDSGGKKVNPDIKPSPFTREMTVNDRSNHMTQNVSKNKHVCEFDADLPPSQDKSASKLIHLFASLKSDSNQTSSASDKPLPHKSDSDAKKVHQEIKLSPFAETPTKAERKTVTIQQKLKTIKEITVKDHANNTTQNVLKNKQLCDFGAALSPSVDKSASRFHDLFANLTSDSQQIVNVRCSSSQEVKEETKFATKAEKTTATIQENMKTTEEMTINDQSSHTTQKVLKNWQDCEFDASLPPQGKSTSRFLNLFASLKSDSVQTSSCSSDKSVVAQSDSCIQKVHLEKNKTTTANDPHRRNQEAGSSTERTEKSLDDFRKSLSFCPSGTEVDRKDNDGTNLTEIAPNPKLVDVKSNSAFQENLKTISETIMNDQSTHTSQNTSEKRQDFEFESSFSSPHNKPTSRLSHLFAKLDSDSDQTFRAHSDSCDNLFTPGHRNTNEDNNQDESGSETIENSKDDTNTVKTPSTFLSLFKNLSAKVDQTSTVSNPLRDKAAASSARKVEKSDRNRQNGFQMTKPSPFMENTLEMMKSSDCANDVNVCFVTERPETSRSIGQNPLTSTSKDESNQHRARTPFEFFKSVFTSISAQLEGASSHCRSFPASATQIIQRPKRDDCSITPATNVRHFPRRRTGSTESDDSRVEFISKDPETSKNSRQKSLCSAVSDSKSKDSLENEKTPPKSNQTLCEAHEKNSTISKSSDTSPEPLQRLPQEERRTTCFEFANNTTQVSASASSSRVSNQSPQQQSNSDSGRSRFKTLFRELRRSDWE